MIVRIVVMVVFSMKQASFPKGGSVAGYVSRDLQSHDFGTLCTCSYEDS